MRRLTVQNEGYESEASRQELIDTLGRYEDFAQSLITLQKQTSLELETLKAQDKTKTLRFREAFGQKIWTQALLNQLVKWGFVSKEEL